MFELMNGKALRMVQEDVESTDMGSKGLEIELLASENWSCNRAKNGNQNKGSPEKPPPFAVGSKLLVIQGCNLRGNIKWPPFRKNYSSPCVIRKVMHIRYGLCSSSGNRSRWAIRARPLILYHEITDYLCLIGTCNVPSNVLGTIKRCSEFVEDEQGNGLAH